MGKRSHSTAELLDALPCGTPVGASQAPRCTMGGGLRISSNPAVSRVGIVLQNAGFLLLLLGGVDHSGPTCTAICKGLAREVQLITADWW